MRQENHLRPGAPGVSTTGHRRRYRGPAQHLPAGPEPRRLSNPEFSAVIEAILADPEFVFRFEHTPDNVAPGTNYRISDLELASRLSYFLWSSAPDDELITVAAQGKLRDPEVLEQQTRRMLADPKSEALSKVFAAEWLHLQNLKDVQPDVYQFPNYDKNLGESMRRETELLFDSIVREDRNSWIC